MPKGVVSADLPLAWVQVGFGIGSAALGVLSLIALVAKASEVVGTLAFTAIFAVIFGVFMWFASRRRQEFQRLNFSHVVGPGRRGPRAAFWRGTMMAVVLASVEALVIGFLDWLWGQPIRDLFPGILLAVAIWMSLDARDLRRWQAGNALVVFTRTDSPSWRFASGQDGRRHVLIPVGPASASGPRP